MDSSLRGKRALVTGGSRGIGAAIVKRFAQDGVDVAFTYARNSGEADKIVAAAKERGVRAVAIQSDSADPAAVTAAVKRTANDLGGLDILVNNAGIASTSPTSTGRSRSTCAPSSWPSRPPWSTWATAAAS